MTLDKGWSASEPPLPAKTSPEWTEGANMPNNLSVAASHVNQTRGLRSSVSRLCGSLALLVVSAARCGWVALGALVVHYGAAAIGDGQLRHGIAQLVLPGVAAHFLVEYVLGSFGWRWGGIFSP